jgi:hypothetical protein
MTLKSMTMKSMTLKSVVDTSTGGEVGIDIIEEPKHGLNSARGIIFENDYGFFETPHFPSVRTFPKVIFLTSKDR